MEGAGVPVPPVSDRGGGRTWTPPLLPSLITSAPSLQGSFLHRTYRRFLGGHILFLPPTVKREADGLFLHRLRFFRVPIEKIRPKGRVLHYQ